MEKPVELIELLAFPYARIMDALGTGALRWNELPYATRVSVNTVSVLDCWQFRRDIWN